MLSNDIPHTTSSPTSPIRNVSTPNTPTGIIDITPIRPTSQSISQRISSLITAARFNNTNNEFPRLTRQRARALKLPRVVSDGSDKT